MNDQNVAGAVGAPVELNTDRPHPARVYDYLLGGDSDHPYGIVTRLVDTLPSGSHVVLSHLTGDFAPEAWEGVAAVYRKSGVTLRVRSHAEIERFFDGLDLLDPGLQSLPDWRPDGDRQATDAQVSVYGGVARKP